MGPSIKAVGRYCQGLADPIQWKLVFHRLNPLVALAGCAERMTKVFLNVPLLTHLFEFLTQSGVLIQELGAGLCPAASIPPEVGGAKSWLQA
jgi:hypothetical protein